MLQSHFHNGAIDSNLESLKNTFNILTLLPLPHDCNDELSSFMNSSINVKVEQIIDHPTNKRSGMRKEVFLKRRQKYLDYVIVFITNIIALRRFWVKVDDDDSPMILNILMDIANLLSSTEYKSFDKKYKGSKNYMSHTLFVYIFNIFAVFVKAAKIPKVIRELKYTKLIKFKHFRMASIMKGNLMEQLNFSIVTCSPNIIFHSAPLTLTPFVQTWQRKKVE